MFSASKLCQSSSISGPSATVKPPPRKICSMRRRDARDGMQPAERLAAAGQSDVHGIAGELRRELLVFELSAARIQRRGQRFLRFVDFRARSLARLGVHRPERLELRGDLALLAEQANANLLQFLDVGRARDFRARGLNERLHFRQPASADCLSPSAQSHRMRPDRSSRCRRAPCGRSPAPPGSGRRSACCKTSRERVLRR